MAIVFGVFMAWGIGANDVANAMGTSVGSGAVTIKQAVIIAVIFEAGGALIAGRDVVKTIKKGIIDPSMIANTQIFIYAMTASLLAGALWLNIATYFKAPVSTTHSIVGGVMGAGIAASGFSVVDWGTMGKIALSWIISPILGGIIAAGFLYFIKKKIIFQSDKISSAKKFVPILISVMILAFSTYLMLKGIKKIIKLDLITALGISGVISVGIFFIIKPMIIKQADNLKSDRDSINQLFTIPLIFAAALLSFAHGANDVANAIGPLAAVNDAVVNQAISAKASIPLWVMMIGAIGIALGLALYGPRLIKTVGSEITELDQIRAYSIAMAAAITVVIASQLGLPVSSTHIAVGGVFGVGFLREWLDIKKETNIIEMEKEELKDEKKTLNAYNNELKSLQEQNEKTKSDYQRIVELYRMIEDEEKNIKGMKKVLKSAEKVKYVKRDMVKKIAAAWIITVPAAAFLSAMIFFIIKGMML